MVDRVILDVQLGHAEPAREPVRTNEGRTSRVEPGERLARNRQQFAVAPEILRTCRDVGRRDGRADRPRWSGRAGCSGEFLTGCHTVTDGKAAKLPSHGFGFRSDITTHYAITHSKKD